MPKSRDADWKWSESRVGRLDSLDWIGTLDRKSWYKHTFFQNFY